jgi:hypothetical protein
MFLLGCLLPDIFLRGGKLLLHRSEQLDYLELYLTPLHTPLTVLVLCVGLAQFFRNRERKMAFYALYTGCLFHFILDFFQRTISGVGFTPVLYGGYQWLYPLSWWDAQVGLYWPEHTPLALAALIPWAGWIRLRRQKGQVENPDDSDGNEGAEGERL